MGELGYQEARGKANDHVPPFRTDKSSHLLGLTSLLFTAWAGIAEFHKILTFGYLTQGRSARWMHQTLLSLELSAAATDSQGTTLTLRLGMSREKSSLCLSCWSWPTGMRDFSSTQRETWLSSLIALAFTSEVEDFSSVLFPKAYNRFYI